MAAPRSAAEHAKLRTRLLSCRCNLYDPQLRALHPSTTPAALTTADKFEMSVLYLCKMLAMAMEFFHSKLHDSTNRWPQGIQDITPFEAEPRELCDAILQWAEGAGAPGAYAVFTLFGGLATICPRIMKYVHKTSHFFRLATQQLQLALASVPTHDVDVLFLPRVAAPVYSCAGSFFGRLLEESAPRDADRMLAVTLPAMRDIALGMEAHISIGATEMGDSRCWFEFVCDRTNGAPFVPRGPTTQLHNEERGYLPGAGGIIVTMRTSKCTFRGCELRVAPKSLHLCGACQVARYCSQEVSDFRRGRLRLRLLLLAL